MQGLIPKMLAGGLATAKENSPMILTGLAVGGVILTAVLAARAVPKAVRIIKEEEDIRREEAEARAKKEQEVLNKDYDEVFNDIYQPVTRKDAFKLTWKCFVPAAICGGITIACIVGAQHVNTVRQAAMAASYEILRNSYDDYRYHVREALDKKKYEEIEQKIRENKIDQIMKDRPLTNREEDILDAGAGAAIFVEPTTGHRWISTYEKMYRAIDDTNELLDSNRGSYNFVSLQTFLHMAGDKDNDPPVIAEHVGFAQRPFEKTIDRATFLKPTIGEHKGHTCTLVYLSTDIYHLDNWDFTR